MSRGHIDAAAGGAFLSLTINGATALIEKMVSNQWWGDERLQDEQQKGMHTVKETYMCNTPGICHQLSNGFELKHDMLSGDDGVKINSQERAPT